MKNKIRKILRLLRQLKMHIVGGKTPVRMPSQMGLTFTDDVREHMQTMMDKTELRSPIVLIRRSLATYDVLTDHVADGGKVIFRYPDGTETVFDPISFREDAES